MASEVHRGGVGLMALIGGAVATSLATGGVVILAQMSGCCGSAPTHGCKFVESQDAAMDSSADMAMVCPLTCDPGSFCCLDGTMEPPLYCVGPGQVCRGVSAFCTGDGDCIDKGQHCCGTVDTMMVRCQAECSGHYRDDQTARICESDQECPPDLPKCVSHTLNGVTLFFCDTP
jgi:hypothetical protein